MESRTNVVTKFFATIFVISIPFFDVPRLPISGLSVSFYISFFFVLSYFFFKIEKRIDKNFLHGCYLFMFFWFFYALSAFLNAELNTEKTFNHVLYYFISFFVYYVCIYFSIDSLGSQRFKKLIAIGLYVVFLIGVFEILLFYFNGFDAYASFLNHDQNVGTSMGLPRMRSTFNEPSHLAIYLLAILPVVFDNHKAMLVWFLAFLTTFSSSAFMGVAVSFFILCTLRPFVLKTYRSFYISFIILLGLSLFLYFTYDTSIVQKIVNASSYDSVRYDAFTMSQAYIDDSIFFGYGPTFYYRYFPYGLFNLYLQLYIEAGLFGLVSFVCFYQYHVVKVGFRDQIMLFSMLSIFFLYIAMDHYYIPGIWFILSSSTILIKNKKS